MSIPTKEVKLMAAARSKASFRIEEMSEFIYGSKKALEVTNAAFKRVDKALGTDDTYKLPPIYSGLNRDQLFLDGLRAGIITFQDGLDHDHGVFEYMSHIGVLGNANPLGITSLLFTPFLKLVGTPMQVAYWLPFFEQGKMTGCYAQTELAHGSYVGGIETLATFDMEKDEFVVHSPNLTSTKFWPGGLGFTATHAIVMARLIIGDKDHGVHPFMMQVRSLDDSKPLPGIELGDIGLKMGYNGTDNGYAVFTHVRIPRSNLLMRYSIVSRTGQYTANVLREKLIYGGMMNGRSLIIRNAAFQLAQVLTITTRYSTVRIQGANITGDGQETAIINYKHQHQRLLALISGAFVTLMAWKSSNEVYSRLGNLQRDGDHSTLPYTHMLMCGLKAWATQTAADGAEEARKMCGGHGYLLMSGLPELVASITAMCTFEGENFVMWGQVARYLMKGMDAVRTPLDIQYVRQFANKDLSTFGYINYCENSFDFAALLHVFHCRASGLIREAYTMVKKSESEGMTRAQAENEHAIPLLVASRAHTEVFIFKSCVVQLTIQSPVSSAQTRAVLKRLVQLFGLTTIASPLAPYASSFNAFLSPTQLTDMRRQVDSLSLELLPDALALTDAWSFSDGMLRSAIGCADGDVYTRILAWTRQLPINVEAVKDGGVFKQGWNEHLEGLLRGALQVKAKL